MKKLLLLLVIFALTISGCDGGATPAVPDTSGDFVKNENGVGTAKVLGVTFNVHVNAGGASSDDSFELDFIDPDQSRVQKQFTIGDDIKVELESVNASDVKFTFNDQDFGMLEVGDDVVIDDQRKVLVNGSARKAAASKKGE